MSKYIVITTLCDKKEIANKIQDTLLSKRLVAGCQISEKESTYWWNGKIEKAIEYHLEMRTKDILYKTIEQEIKKIHDYDVCEISYYEIKDGNKEFFSWIEDETK